MSFSDSDATRILQAIDTRIERGTKSGASIQYTWGTVGALDAYGKTASAYILGETDGAYMSEGFRVPETMYLTIGDSIKVAIDYSTGDRWVDEVNVSSAYKKVSIGSDGVIRFGDGASAPSTTVYSNTADSIVLPSNVNIGGISDMSSITPGVIIARNITGKGFFTTGAGSSTNGYWAKVAYGSITIQYTEAFGTFDILQVGDGGGNMWYGRLVMRVKQQNAFGSQPNVYLDMDGQLSYNSALVAITSVAGPTTWELWIKTEASYGGPVAILQSQGSQTIVMNTAPALQASLPSGTLYYAEAHVVPALQIGGRGAGLTSDGMKITSSGNVEMRSPSPFIDFKVGSDDFGARIIYNYYVVDGLEFTGAAGGYVFDNNVKRSGEAWTEPTLTNSWVNYGGGWANAAYRKDAQGYVHLRGLIKSGTLGSSAFLLPAGFRPAYTHMVLGHSNVNSTWSIANEGRIDITSSGSVVPHPTECTNTWVSLDGIIFLAEG